MMPEAIVHHVNGQFSNAQYRSGNFSVTVEVGAQFDISHLSSKNIYLIVFNSSSVFVGTTGKVRGWAAT